MPGDASRWLLVCKSVSGDVPFRWRGNSAALYSVATNEDGIIVSNSRDGTLARW